MEPGKVDVHKRDTHGGKQAYINCITNIDMDLMPVAVTFTTICLRDLVCESNIPQTWIVLQSERLCNRNRLSSAMADLMGRE